MRRGACARLLAIRADPIGDLFGYGCCYRATERGKNLGYKRPKEGQCKRDELCGTDSKRPVTYTRRSTDA